MSSEDPATSIPPPEGDGRGCLKWITCLALLLAIPLAGEVLVRFLCPFVNYQGADHHLFRLDSSGNRVAWQEGARGICFGQEVQIDEHGCLSLPGAPSTWEKSLLILGDSVAFGTGVPPQETFAGLLQASSPELKIWNASVVGMDMNGYPEVLRTMLQTDPLICKVLLFFCLNDIYSTLDATALTEVNRPAALEWTMDLFRKRSKLFLFLKGTLLDRSRGMFLWDYQIYRDMNTSAGDLFAPLSKVSELAEEEGIPVTVILLPYEYQLRAREDEYWYPQDLVKNFLCQQGIPFQDAYEWLTGGDSKDSFLFADGMHLSKPGHQRIFKGLVSDDLLSLVKISISKENNHDL